MDDTQTTTLLAAHNGTAVELRDVANVTVGNLPRLGIAGQDNDDDIVQGIGLMRRGEQSMPTNKRIEAEVPEDQHHRHPSARRADRTHL